MATSLIQGPEQKLHAYKYKPAKFCIEAVPKERPIIFTVKAATRTLEWKQKLSDVRSKNPHQNITNDEQNKERNNMIRTLIVMHVHVSCTSYIVALSEQMAAQNAYSSIFSIHYIYVLRLSTFYYRHCDWRGCLRTDY